MEKLEQVLDREIDENNTRSQMDDAKARLEEIESNMLCPVFDGEKYVETSCLTCRDLGWVTFYPPHPTNIDDFGNVQVFPCPDCGGFDRTATMLKYSGIPEISRSQRFENFKRLPSTEKALTAVKSLTAQQATLETQIIFVLIYGGCGNGKTHLAHASGIEAINQGLPTKFVRCGALLREFKASKSLEDEGQAKFEALFKQYTEVLYLIIDELDWKTDADIHMIDNLVCERWANHLQTLITSNQDLPELDDTFPRMMSRFRDNRFSRLVLNEGEDYRRLKK